MVSTFIDYGQLDAVIMVKRNTC